MEKNTNEMILQKLLQIEFETKDGFKKMTERFNVIEGAIEENRRAVFYIGEKVFDNHEKRIKVLEKKIKA